MSCFVYGRYVHVRIADPNNQSQVVGYALVRSLIVTAMNFGFQYFCKTLTKFEHHRSISTYRKHFAAKLYFFQTLSTTVAVNSNFYAVQNPLVPVSRCFLDMMGVQLLTNVMTDLVMSVVLNVVVPTLKRSLKSSSLASAAGKDSVSADQSRPLTTSASAPADHDQLDDTTSGRFDPFSEYQTLLVRQFIICYGFPSSPLLPLIGGLAANTVQYWCDKHRLLNSAGGDHYKGSSGAGTIRVADPVRVRLKRARALQSTLVLFWVLIPFFWFMNYPTVCLRSS